MNVLYTQLQKHFIEGRFSDIIDLCEQSSPSEKDQRSLPYWIGSLVLSGNLDKALILFEKTNFKSDEPKIACHFYLSLGSIRNSQYRQGRKFLVENLKHLNKKIAPTEKFFIFQGLAFYRFFCGRFSQSKKYAELAYKAAVQADFLFGEILSKELLAHSLIQTGQVRLGLRYFDETYKIAHKAKNWVAPAIEIAILKFKAQFGINPQTGLSDLEAALDKIETRDIYSKGELLLEMVRQHILRGQFSKAEDALSKAADIIYKNQNRRQMALLNLRMSYVLFLQAQLTQSLHILRIAEQNVDPVIDLSLWTQINGLKLTLLNHLKKNSDAQKLFEELNKTSVNSQNAIHQRMMARSTQKEQIPFPKGEDPIGDLLDQVYQGDSKAPATILKSGYFGLLHKCYQLPFGTQCLIFDLHPGSLVLLDKGNVSLKATGVNSVLRKIILLIKDESQTKEELVQKVWGYQYDPFRHDPLIYSSMNKVRKLLSPHGDWIQLTENGYQIQKNIKVIIKNTLKQKSLHQKVKEEPVLRNVPNNKIKVPPKWHKHAKDLNFRQLQVLDYLKNQNSISVLELSQKLLISKPTATRDLSKLHKLGILSRAGHGRATRYFL